MTWTTTFEQWLVLQGSRQDAVGDLARDYHDDDCWPRWSPLPVLLDHLAFEHAANERALDALAAAWNEWAGP